MTQPFTFREPTAKDGAAIFAMMQPYKPKIGTNPLYTYLVQCEYFAGTCVAVEKDGELIAFTSAFIPPQKPDTLYIWEIAVKEGFHGHGLMDQMLRHLLAKTGSRFLEATVNPSNTSSSARFRNLAQAMACPCDIKTLFPESYFAPLEHEDEVLYRIGPFAPLAAAA